MYRPILFPKPQDFSISVYIGMYTLDLSMKMKMDNDSRRECRTTVGFAKFDGTVPTV